jgi:hypothetical protein
MSKQTGTKNQASRSDVHDSMPNVYGTHSKESQRPSKKAHEYSGDRTSLDPCESRDKTPKKKPEPAHQGPRSVSEPDETITKRNQETKRK